MPDLRCLIFQSHKQGEEHTDPNFPPGGLRRNRAPIQVHMQPVTLPSHLQAGLLSPLACAGGLVEISTPLSLGNSLWCRLRQVGSSHLIRSAQSGGTPDSPNHIAAAVVTWNGRCFTRLDEAPEMRYRRPRLGTSMLYRQLLASSCESSYCRCTFLFLHSHLNVGEWAAVGTFVPVP